LVQIPFTQRLIDKYKGQNIVFLYLSVDEDKTQWRQYLKTQNWAGIQAHDADIIPLNFGVQALPYTLLIDKNGRIAYNSLLNSKITAEQMIDVLLKK
jgi:hypothetical protein